MNLPPPGSSGPLTSNQPSIKVRTLFQKIARQEEKRDDGQVVTYLDIIQFDGFEILFEELTHTGTL